MMGNIETFPSKQMYPIVIIATGPHMSWMNWTCQNQTYMATNDPNLSKIIIVLDFVIVINGTEMNPTSPRYQKISSKDGNYTELANKLQFLRFPSNGNLNERESQKIEINTGNSCYLSAARRRRGRFFSPIGSGPRGSGWWNGDHGKYHKTLVEADVGCGTWDCSFIQIQPVSERPSS